MILRARGGDVELRSAQIAGAVIPSPGDWGGGIPGVAVNQTTVGGVPAAAECIRMAGEAVASCARRVVRGPNRTSRDVVAGTWQARLFRGSPNASQTAFSFWQILERSLTARGNAFVWKVADDQGRVAELWALHPDQVAPARGGADGYVVAFGRGWPNPYGAKTGTREVPRGADLMHISADGDEWSASPIERFRVLLATAIAEQRLGAETYSRGARVQNVLTHPQRLNSDQKRELRDSWESMHEGTGARRTAILDGGIDLKSVSMTLSDAQWIQSRGLTAQEVARALHWPASLLDALSKGSITPELEDIRTSRWYVMPRLLRLEDAFNADPWLFGAGSRDRLVLDPMPVRGDLRTEAATDVALVQVGIELVDETRARRGLDPLPGGVGQIPQITPVGGAPNPLSLAPDPAPAE